MTRTGVVPGAPGVVIPGLEAGEERFHFLSGRRSLALVATVGERWRRNFERLLGPEHLDRWLVEAELLRRAADATEADLRVARELRDAIHVLCCDAEDGRPLAPSACAVVERHAAAPDLVPGFGGLVVPSGTRRPARAALSTVARDAVDLFTSPAAAGVRHCAADDCSLVYLDSSRGQRRRWCSMQGCGNRAKQRAHRRRATA